MSLPAPLPIQTAYLTDPGRVRDENQDACLELRGPAGEELLLVADGMGGYQGGATASQLVVNTFRDFFEHATQWHGEMLRAAITEANTRIRRTASETLELAGMGTTAVAILFGRRGGSGWVAHVGDSRAYRLHNGALERLTEDHSTVAELLHRGAISEAEAEHHPQRNEILRSIGIEESVKVDLAPMEVELGDRFLLCSDGLSCVVRDDEIAVALGGLGPADAVRTLVESANTRGGPDNVTVMVSTVENGIERATSVVPKPQRGLLFAVVGATVAVLIALTVALFFLRDQLDPVGGRRAGDSDARPTGVTEPFDDREEVPENRR
jgi:protein phosphatase